MATIASLPTTPGVHTIAPGTYTGVAQVFNPTASPVVWLASAPGVCILDTSTTAKQANFQSGSQNILLVGWAHHGRLNIAGKNIWTYWHDASFPGISLSAGGIVGNLGGFNSPDLFDVTHATNSRHYGPETHNGADHFDTNGTHQLYTVGHYAHAFIGNPANGQWHCDTYDCVQGRGADIAVDQFFWDMGVAGDGFEMEARQGNIRYALSNGWLTRSSNVAVHNITVAGQPWTITGTRTNLYSWSHNSGVDRKDDGPSGQIHVTDTNVRLSAPSGTNPAAAWKLANPYGAWASQPDIAAFLAGTAVAPAAPINVTANPGNGLVIVNFSPPPSDGGSPIDKYRATITPDGTSVESANGLARQISVPATNGTSYTATVAAHNAIGYGPDSTPSNVVTPTAATPPGTPSINVIAIFDTSVVLGWTKPAANGAPLDAFRVTVTWVASGGGTITRDFPGDALGGTVVGLVASRAYTVVVKAHNSQGYGSNSSSVGFTTLASVSVLHWSDSIHGTMGTVEQLSASQQTAMYTQTLAAGMTGQRYDLNIEAFRANATTADAVINRMLAAGIDDILIIANHLGNGTYPNHSTLATNTTLFGNIASHFRTLVGGSVRLNFEWLNETNFNYTPRSVKEYMFWYKAFFNAAKAADSTCFVGPTGPGHAVTNKPPSPTEPQVSNVYGQAYNASLPQQWSETDFIADCCNVAVVGAGFTLQSIGCDFVGIHPYAIESGPLALFGAPAGFNTPNVVVNGMREASRVDVVLTAAGISSPLWATEVGYPHAPAWVSGTSYAVDTVLFNDQGTPNGDLWNRPVLQICTTAHMAATGNRPGAPGAPWRAYTQADVARVGYSGSVAVNAISTENEAAFHLANTLNIIFGARADADNRKIGNRWERAYIFTPRNWPGATGFKYGLTDENGGLLGQPTSSGPLAALSALSGNIDTRGQSIVVTGAGWEAIGSIPTDL